MTTEIHLQGRKIERYLKKVGVETGVVDGRFSIGSFPDKAGQYEPANGLTVELGFERRNHDFSNRLVRVGSNKGIFRGSRGRRYDRLVTVDASGNGKQQIADGVEIIIHTDAMEDVFVASEHKTDQ